MTRLSPARIAPLLVALLALGSGLLMLSHAVYAPDGSAALPIDDAYIHLQYARQAADGHFLQYNSGDPVTTGETSLLYMAILTAGFVLGIPARAMPTVTLLLGLSLFPVAAALLTDLIRRAVDLLPTENDESPAIPAWGIGLLGGVIFAGSGWMGWAFLNGMETGLLIALVVGVLWAWTADRLRLTALLTSLLVLTRPEMLILPVVMLGVMLLLPRRDGSDRRRLAWAVVPLVVAALPLLLNLALTGTISAAGFQAKSRLTHVPLYLDTLVRDAITAALDLFARLFGGLSPDGRWYVLPLAQVAAIAGGWWLLRRGGSPGRRLALVLAGWFGLTLGALTTLENVRWEVYRYQMPLYVAITVLAALGLARLAQAIARRWGARIGWAAGVGFGGFVVLWMILTLPGFAESYTTGGQTTVGTHIALADWMRTNTPPETRFAVADVGATRYLGERHTFDIVGLTTSGQSPYQRNGPGAIYESLENFRPEYYVVYRDTTVPFYGLASASDLFGEVLFRVEMGLWVDAPGVSDQTETQQLITRPDWSGAELAEAPQQPSTLALVDGWTPLDRLDVADVADEAAHDYRWWQQGRPDGFMSVPRVMPYREDPALTLADGGRRLTGGEAFTVAAPDSGEWLLLVVRLHQFDDMTLRVRVNGREAGLWRLPRVPGQWLERGLLIAPDLLDGPTARFELSVAEASPGFRYQPFHYWVYAGQPDPPPPSPATASGAAFGQTATLYGFDLETRQAAPGEAITLRLHWGAIDPPQADTRFFVHLTDPTRADSADGVLAQFDGPPRMGTYPFWVWERGETVLDTVTIAVPPETPPGDYVLLLGVYDGLSGARLPIRGGEDFGGGRLLLAEIAVR